MHYLFYYYYTISSGFLLWHLIFAIPFLFGFWTVVRSDKTATCLYTVPQDSDLQTVWLLLILLLDLRWFLVCIPHLLTKGCLG